MTDLEAFERLRKGDHEAFELIFRTHYAQLVGFAEGMLRHGGAAEEIVQDVMLELWRRRDALVLTGSLRAYLYRATRNRVLNELRHERVVARAAEKSREGRHPASAADAAEEREIDAAVRRAVQDLPDRCREVFELSRGHGLRYSEIAETLGISVKTVEAQMGKALRILRERLAPWLGGAAENPDPGVGNPEGGAGRR